MNDSGVAAIALRFGVGAGAAIGQGADAVAMSGAGLLAPRKRPVTAFPLPPGQLSTTAAGTFADFPDQWAPPLGWLWDVTMLSVTGFTAGAIVVAKNAPAVNSAGGPVAIEPLWTFAAQGQQNFPQKGNPLLDANDRLVFCVTSALTAPNGVTISGMVVAVPAERVDEYLS